MPVVTKVNTKKTFDGIRSNVKQFVYGVTSIGAKNSMFLAPIEWGDLRASQKMTTWISATGYHGMVTFGEGLDGDYAAILENKLNWKPRPPELKAGPAWNPNTYPQYLKLGFEGMDAKGEIEILMKKLIL